MKACIAWIKTQMLWQSTLHSASFICPASLLLRTEPPNWDSSPEGGMATVRNGPGKKRPWVVDRFDGGGAPHHDGVRPNRGPPDGYPPLASSA